MNVVEANSLIFAANKASKYWYVSKCIEVEKKQRFKIGLILLM